MATQAFDRDQIDLNLSRKTLILIWQNPDSRRFIKVGQVDALPEGRVAFQYLASAWEDPEFVPLLEYPDRDAAYISDEVPAFFANRILSADRPNYDRYLDWLGLENLDVEEIPFEVLARTGGGRATDTFHVVDLPLQHSDSFSSRFFVSGIRYVEDSKEVLAKLEIGEELNLCLDEGNPVNTKAVLVNTTGNRTVGYVPDWLCADVHGYIKDAWEICAIVERVNPDAPAHVRLLCRIEARLISK